VLRSTASLLFVPLFLLAVSPALAQGYREAEIEFNRGELLLEMKDYPRALFAFNKAYSILPDNRYLAGLVKAYEAKGEKEKALLLGERYLERQPAERDPDVEAIVRALRTTVSENAGRVDFLLSPSGGKITFLLADGRQEIRAAPDKELTRWLPPGKSVVVYEKSGFVGKKAELTVEAGKPLSVALVLDRAKGNSELLVACNVTQASVVLDGKEIGKTPLRKTIESGDHVLQVWAPNHLAWTGVVDAPAGQGVSINAQLVPSTTRVAKLPSPTVTVRKKVTWLNYFFGGITVGCGLALAGATVSSFIKMNQAWDEAVVANAAGDTDLVAKRMDEYSTHQTWAWVSLASSVLQLAGGLTLLLVKDDENIEKSAPFELLTISPVIRQDGIYVGASWTF
jgi:hypothetical protein